ncbi:hypothetical protein ACFL1U_02700 [Patescibacteria group bacterium]
MTKPQKNTLLAIIIIIVALAAIVLVGRFAASKDDWICDDGQWVKHGVPSAPMPTKPCT